MMAGIEIRVLDFLETVKNQRKVIGSLGSVVRPQQHRVNEKTIGLCRENIETVRRLLRTIVHDLLCGVFPRSHGAVVRYREAGQTVAFDRTPRTLGARSL